MRTQHQNLGVTVVFYDALARGKQHLGTILEDKIIAYEHVLSAVGGFDTAKIGIAANIETIERWVSEGLARHIEVYSHKGILVYEGFVDTIEANAAGLSLVIGPVLEVDNRVSVMYTPIIDPTADPQILGTLTETTIVDDEDSQNMYGILERVLSGGNMVDDGVTNDAEYARDLYIAENCYPRTTNDLTVGGDTDVSLVLNCRGYYHVLGKYVYNDGVYNYSVQCSTKLRNVLAADPNGWFSTDYSLIDDNLALTNGLENQNKTALDVIKDILNLGDGLDNRWCFGIYGGLKPVYAAVPSDVAYLYSIYGSERSEITLPNGKIVRPWEVLPGRWALVPDFLAGKTEGIVGLRRDTRAIFIESVSYTAPYGVSLRGENIRTLPQAMARLGYGGIS